MTAIEGREPPGMEEATTPRRQTSSIAAHRSTGGREVMDLEAGLTPGDRAEATSRVPELDFLRGIGALAILAFHLWPTTFFLGWSRVDLFFVISGYLITSITLKYGNEPRFLFKFYVRRILRTWPAYFALVAVVYGISARAGEAPNDGVLAYFLTFSQNIPYYWRDSPPFQFPLLSHTWCLAVEEQFYLLWPPLVLACRGRFLVPLSVWVMLNSVILRSTGLHSWTLAARCDGLALGALLAALLGDREWTRTRLPTLRFVFALVALVAAALVVALHQASVHSPARAAAFGGSLSVSESTTLFLVALFQAGLVALVVCHSGRPEVHLLHNRAICALGRVSYGIYLYNFVIIMCYIRARGGSRPTLPAGLGLFVLCVVVGAASWMLFEKPTASLKRFFPYRAVREPTVEA